MGFLFLVQLLFISSSLNLLKVRGWEERKKITMQMKMLTFRGAELYFFQSRRPGSKWAEIITKIIVILAIVFLIIRVRGGK